MNTENNSPEQGAYEAFIKAFKKLGLDYDEEKHEHYNSANPELDLVTYNFKFYAGSTTCQIQLELNKELDGTELCYQCWVGDSGPTSFYHENYWEENHNNIEGNIEELYNKAKSYNKLKRKIDGLLDEIREELEYNNCNVDFDVTAKDLLD